MKLSIIIPAYNAEKSIERAINSCSSFDEEQCEIIVVDDCSNDSTLIILNELNFKNLIILKNPINKGVSYSRNLGVSHASGEYCIFLDSDDFYLENAGENVFIELESDKLDMYCFGYLINGKPSPKPKMKNKKLYLDFMCSKFSNTNTIVTKRSILIENKFREDFRVGEDTDLWFRLLFNYNAKFFDKAIAFYDYSPKLNAVDEHPLLKLSLPNLDLPESEFLYVKNKIEANLILKKAFSRRITLFDSFNLIGIKGLIFWLGGEKLFILIWKLRHKFN